MLAFPSALPFAEDTDPPSLATAADKWVNLVNGETYELNGISYRWDGLKGFNKSSCFLAAYIYCMYQLENQTITTGTGEGKLDPKNVMLITSTSKFINAWQFFLKRYQAPDMDIPRVIINGFGTYGLDYQNNQNEIRSLYQYLTDKNTLDPSNFPNLNFKGIALDESYNSFGI